MENYNISNEIIEGNLVILTITKLKKKIYNNNDNNENQNIKDQIENSVFKNYSFATKNNFQNENELKEVLKSIYEKSLNFKNKKIFIIFNEYFFGESICDNLEKNYLFDLLHTQFKDLKDLYIFINILIREEKPSDEEIEKMKIYQKPIKF